MEVADYRKQYEAELAKKPLSGARRAQPGAGTREQVAVVRDRGAKATARIEAIDRLAGQAASKPSVMKALLKVLADTADDAAVRRAALEALQQNTFSAVEFSRYAPDYKAALRSVATDDEPALRERALDLLALEGDEYAQRLLVEGLQEPANALVPAPRALGMIGYDVHAEHYGLLRDIVATSKKSTERRAALRLLSADGDAQELLTRVATDKSEDRQSRATSAMALQSLAPEHFASIAREVVVDDDDDDEVRTAFLNALGHGDTDPTPEFVAEVRAVEASTSSPKLTKAARRYTRRADGPT